MLHSFLYKKRPLNEYLHLKDVFHAVPLFFTKQDCFALIQVTSVYVSSYLISPKPLKDAFQRNLLTISTCHSLSGKQASLYFFLSACLLFYLNYKTLIKCASAFSLPKSSIVSASSGPCICPETATRIGINRFFPLTPVFF